MQGDILVFLARGIILENKAYSRQIEPDKNKIKNYKCKVKIRKMNKSILEKMN